MDQNNLCEYLAGILKGKAEVKENVCTVTVDRKDIQATIGNKPFHSLMHMFDFESPDHDGNALITGEMVLLESEVPKIVSTLTRAGIIVSAIHSHWLFDNPKLMYIHMVAVMNPAQFAADVSQALYS